MEVAAKPTEGAGLGSSPHHTQQFSPNDIRCLDIKCQAIYSCFTSRFSRIIKRSFWRNSSMNTDITI
jgi:hypothetical protein